jgi:rare lipoprotein A
MRLLALLGLELLSACTPRPAASPHYELGRPYQVNGVWFYPRESFDSAATGLASVYGTGHSPLTSDGEVFDQSLVMAGHPTIQLPAVARLTNLENGRAMLVRINDRGTGVANRLIQVTRRTAVLLGMNEASATRVRMEILPEESHAATDSLPNRPQLNMTVAPRDTVTATALPPPPGVRAEAGRIGPTAPVVAADAAPAAPARLPETVTQNVPNPGRLWVRLDTFEEYQYAAAQRARMSYLGAAIEKSFNGRVHRFWARIGPLDTVRQADDALAEALTKGIPDALIVVE